MAVAGSRWSRRARNAALPNVPKPSACVTMSPHVSKAIIFLREGRFRSRCSAPRARSKMSAQHGIGDSPNYFARLIALIGLSATQLVRSPSSSRRADAARRTLRQASLLIVIVGPAIVVLMYTVDAREIVLMPARGTASLWPVRVFTDFGKATLVLSALAAMLCAVAIISPRLQGNPRALLLRFGTHLEFLFFAVLVPVLSGEVIKWIVGRGRPFVGGKANAFNFEHFAGTDAYASFPSAHSITSFALAFAVAAAWPRTRAPMAVSAILIALSR